MASTAATASTTDGTLEPGTIVDGYRVMRLIGRGGMGEVYLGRDLLLGRKVALKRLRASVGSGNAADLERLLEEARATASFNHPHIVTVYGAGTYEGAPYVVLELIEGDTLAQRLGVDRPSRKETIRIGLAIALALEAAHHAGILHRDLKPANVLLGQDGRPRVVDFGLALQVGTDGQFTAGIDAGTPAYMAPEQWRREALTPTTDIWALGVILYELLYGRHPFERATTTDELRAWVLDDRAVAAPASEEPLGDGLAALIATCLAKRAADRPTAARVRERLQRLDLPERPPSEQSPFRGLEPFAEEHHALFFGREAQVDEFLERLRHHAILPIVGASGAGKSSLVRAGVVPRLREQGAWIVLQLRPSRQPFRELARALLALGEDEVAATAKLPSDPERQAPLPAPAIDLVDALAARLAESPGHLGLLLRARAEQDRARVFLFLDQLDELFTHVADPAERAAVLRALAEAADDAADPVRLCFSIRDDFLGRLAEADAGRALLQQVFALSPLDAGGLRAALDGPVRLAGYRFAPPTLIDEMVAAVSGEPNCLPLIQFAAQKLWEGRDVEQRQLTEQVYRSFGGVAGALAAHADGLLAGLPAADRSTVRALLLRLVTEDETRRLRQRRALESGLGERAPALVDRLITARLVSLRRGSADDADPELELSHESLIHGWGTLRRWIEESRGELAMLRQLSEAADLWQRRGAREEEAWVGEALLEARRSQQHFGTPLPEDVEHFLQAGERVEARRRRRRRGIAIGAIATLIGIAASATVTAALYAQRRREAEGAAQEARHREAEALRQGARAALGKEAPLEATARLLSSLEIEDSTLARALAWRLQTTPLLWQHAFGATIYDVAFAPDGRSIAAASQDRSIYVIDLHTFAQRVLRGAGEQATSVAFSPDGQRLAAGTWSGDVFVWTEGRTTPQKLVGHTSAAWGLTFSGNERLVTSSIDRTIRIWELPSGKAAATLTGHQSEVNRVAISPDGKTLASSGTDGTIRLWSMADPGATPRQLTGHEGAVLGIVFSPDGKRLASNSWDHSARIWNLETLTSERVFALPGDKGAGITWSPDGTRLAAAAGNEIWIWDPSSGKTVGKLVGHRDSVLAVRFSPDGRHLLTCGFDNKVRLWSLTAPGADEEAHAHRLPVVSVAFDPEGKRLATTGYDRTVRLWDAATGEALQHFVVHQQRAYAVAWSPDGTRLATASEDASVRFWNPRNGRELGSLSHPASVYDLAWSGDRMVTAATDGVLRLFDTTTRRPLGELLGHRDRVYDLAFRADGKEIVSGSYDNTVRLWDATTRRVLRVFTGHSSPVDGVAIRPDGSEIFSAASDRTVRRWQRDGSGQLLGKTDGRGYRMALSPDGRTLATAHSDRAVRLFDLLGGEPRTLLGHLGEVNDVVFSPDGRRLATVSDDATVRLWDTATGEPCWRGPFAGTSTDRLLTHRGWRALSTDTPVTETTAWMRAVQTSRLAHEGAGNGIVCAWQPSGALEVWSIAEDRRVASTQLTGTPRDLAGSAAGCVALSTDAAWFVDRDGGGGGAPIRGAQAIAADRDMVAVLAGDRLRVHSGAHAGRELAVGGGATAIGLSPQALYLGFADGTLERWPFAGAPQTLALEDVPASDVMRILPGPRDTLLVGYANGTVGVWDPTIGAALASVRLHGPVVHLMRRGAILHAATALGDATALDLEIFDRPYCELLAALGKEHPYRWEEGQVRRVDSSKRRAGLAPGCQSGSK